MAKWMTIKYRLETSTTYSGRYILQHKKGEINNMQLEYVSQLCVSHHEESPKDNVEKAHLWKQVSGVESMSTTNMRYSHQNIDRSREYVPVWVDV